MIQSDNDNQSSSVAATVANVPLLHSVAPKATIRRKPVQDIATPAKPGSVNLPVAQATIPTAQVMILVDHTTADISPHPTAQAAPVNPTFAQPTAQVLSASAAQAYRDAPQYPHSTPGRYQSRYDYSRGDVPSQDDYYGNVDAYGNPRNYRGNYNANFAVSKGKGKGKFPNPKGRRNAAPKEWDPDYVVIPEFGIAQGMSLYTLNHLVTPGLSTYTVRTPKNINRSLVPGHSIESMSDREIRMRTNPSDLNGDGTPIHNVVFHYNTALRAIYEVRQSANNFHLMEETGRIIDLMGNPIPNGYPTDPRYLLEETQKASLGDFWRSLRLRPAKTAIKSSYPDTEYIPNNTYSYFQVKKTLLQSSRFQVKACRYWNELPAESIDDETFYSLCDYWPSMPHDVDIVNENSLLGLPLYRMNELSKTVAIPAKMGAKAYFANNNSYTIEFLLSTGAIAEDSKDSFEEYLTSICEAEMKYIGHIMNWPFLASLRLLRLQHRRLKTIKQALIERLDQFPANGGGLNNPDPNADHTTNNPSNMVIEEGEHASSSAEDIDLRLWQSGATDEDNAQSETRPGQNGPGGWNR